ncbi:MAG: Flp family type IVb pilin [Firmicutes bacterium]|nr:Flp family type IVb pilin [Bacillota bacterium]
MKRLLKRLLHEESGQGMVEYGLILALVAVVVIAALTLLGGKLKDLFNKLKGEIETTVPSS